CLARACSSSGSRLTVIFSFGSEISSCEVRLRCRNSLSPNMSSLQSGVVRRHLYHNNETKWIARITSILCELLFRRVFVWLLLAYCQECKAKNEKRYANCT